MTVTYLADEDFAKQLDAEDPLREFLGQISFAARERWQTADLFRRNSLGLMPKAARQIVKEELDNWARLGVDCPSRDGNTCIPITKLCANRQRGSLARSTRSDLMKQSHGKLT